MNENKHTSHLTLISCIVLAIASAIAVISGICSGKNYPEYDVSANTFTLMMADRTLVGKEPLKVTDNDNGWNPLGINSIDPEGNISYEFMTPISVTGNNIKSITYTLNGADFKITDSEFISSVKPASQQYDTKLFDGGKADSDKYNPEFCSSFTVDYRNQAHLTDNHCIWILDKTNNPTLVNIYANNYYNTQSENSLNYYFEAVDKVCDYLLNDVSLTCTVTYKNGTTADTVLYFICHNYENVYCSVRKGTKVNIDDFEEIQVKNHFCLADISYKGEGMLRNINPNQLNCCFDYQLFRNRNIGEVKHLRPKGTFILTLPILC